MASWIQNFSEAFGFNASSPSELPGESGGNFIQLYSGILVLSMHLGFAMLEAGSVTSGSAVNILFKNIGTLAIGAMAYYSIGRGFGSGSLTVFGDGPFFFDEQSVVADYSAHAPWFFSYSFVATAATIVSGAVAGRIKLPAYFLIAFLITGVVYPPITASIWSSVGWLSAFSDNLILTEVVDGDLQKCGMFDFAGSGVVHMTGGVAAFWAALLLGPREGRWEKPEDFAPHNYALTLMGTLFLWFGWYGFNCGSALGWYEGTIGKVAVTTTLAPCFCCVTVFLYCRLVRKKWDLGMSLNGILAGLVAITAGCPTIPNGLAAITGILAAFVFIGASKLMKLIKVDDPVDAVAVHGFCGAWGVFATGLFARSELISAHYGVNCVLGPAKTLQYQMIGIVYILGWTSALVLPLVFVLRVLGVLRLSADTQKNLDVSEHGIGAYEVLDK